MFKNLWRVAIVVPRRLATYAEATKPASSKTKRKSTVTQQIVDHFQTSEQFRAHYPYMNPDLLKRRHNVPIGINCMSESDAENIFSSIKGHLNPDIPIIELYPGLGLLTRRLLTLNPKKILAYESDAYFKSVMDSIASDNAELQVYKTHFLRIWSDDLKDKLDGGNRVAQLLPGIEKKEWEDEPAVQIIGVTAQPRYFQFFVNCIAFQCGIISYGRMELYMTVPPEIFWNINCNAASLPMIYSKYLLFNMFFDYELLCLVDEKSFVPWFKRGDRKIAFLKNLDVNRDKFCLMKAVPKRDLLKVIPPRLLTSLWFFTYQGTTTTRNKVIPYLEKWIPDCGPLFISKGLTVFTDFRDLTSNELLDIFVTFVSLPGFEDCPFQAALESFLNRTDDEGLDEEVDRATSGFGVPEPVE
ncbi:hypothetical protein GE061_010457 [Apolygus lucorum]|uniref:rRNA adenine N(6)-methyltransferase n=1 Tax=Apolygus lucorum TaxID=248454 RepID=A0A8S9XW30_APOLU|nr:hypothetical protein GE061_010457 [Apolygus lucorum]